MEVFSPAVVCSGGYLVAYLWVKKINMRRYRVFIRDIDGERFCYPQVRFRRFMLWGRWRKIVQYNNQGPNMFGLYPNYDYSYGKSYDECLKIIYGYEKHLVVTVDIKIIPVVVIV